MIEQQEQPTIYFGGVPEAVAAAVEMHQAHETEQQDEASQVETFNASVEELNRSMTRLGEQLREWLERIMPDVQRMLNRLHAALFPERHKRMMLREARRRARVSTQVRRHGRKRGS